MHIYKDEAFHIIARVFHTYQRGIFPFAGTAQKYLTG